MSGGLNQNWVAEHGEPVKSDKVKSPPRPLSTWELFWLVTGACFIASTAGTVAGWIVLAFVVVIFQAMT